MSALEKLARDAGLEVVNKGNGHLQITGGALLVNYYPFSKGRAAYIAGTRKSFKNVTDLKAIEMALSQPKVVKTPAKRSQYRARKWRKQMLAKHPFCVWCGEPLTIETATIEHKIPLSRGGLDNRNNTAIACEPCNTKRGNNMIELGE